MKKEAPNQSPGAGSGSNPLTWMGLCRRRGAHLDLSVHIPLIEIVASCSCRYAGWFVVLAFINGAEDNLSVDVLICCCDVISGGIDNLPQSVFAS